MSKIKATLHLECDKDFIIDDETLKKYYENDIRKILLEYLKEEGKFGFIDLFSVKLGECKIE